MAVTKKRLSINLSFLNLTKQSSNRKSPKTFHDQNGVVGLQILAALNHDHDTHHQDSNFINSLSSGLVSIPPYSNLTPKSSRNPFVKKLNMEEMELCEEYTCVISHTGDNVIKKREYFEADLLGKDEVRERAHVVSGDCRGFLNTCFLCDKVLHGLDVFMYRGEKAFCSVECRHEQILIEENKEMRRRSKMRDEPLDDWSASPCSSSSPLQFFARVAAA